MFQHVFLIFTKNISAILVVFTAITGASNSHMIWSLGRCQATRNKALEAVSWRMSTTDTFFWVWVLIGSAPCREHSWHIHTILCFLKMPWLLLVVIGPTSWLLIPPLLFSRRSDGLVYESHFFRQPGKTAMRSILGSLGISLVFRPAKMSYEIIWLWYVWYWYGCFQKYGYPKMDGL